MNAIPAGAGVGGPARRSASASCRLKVVTRAARQACGQAAVSALSRFSTAVCALAAKSPNRARSSSIDLWSSEMLFTTATVGE